MVEFLAQVTPTLNQALVGLLVALPSLLLAYFGYKKSQKVDAVATRAGVIEAESAATQVVLDGLDNIIGHLERDNERLRENLDSLMNRLDEQDNLIGDLREQIEGLRDQLSEALEEK